ncbi:hypothetical protein ACFYWD_20930 [Streptomyces sp. NPDC003781]|uniref:hypothetical protein n=1 Tax=Streptomyces sp. NPDC003781 TaxID=3364686 RepID=UPI0036A3CC00
MDIRPVDLPELRADVVEWINSTYAAEMWASGVDQKLWDWCFGPAGRDQATLRALEADRLDSAELYYVSSDMGSLARAAARSVPGFALQAEDVPSRCGLMLFETPPHVVPFPGAPCGVKAVCWGPMPPNGNGIYGTVYLARDEAAPHIAKRTKSRRPWTEPRLIYGFGAEFAWEFGENDGASPDSDGFLEGLAPALRATWLLMQQTLARTDETEPTRASAKRLRRVGREPSPVRVIELRRPAHSGSGDGSREFHHQWIVRGHWRQQWYPARQVHRPVWIAPHIKGPEGAPMIGGEKVYAWKR